MSKAILLGTAGVAVAFGMLAFGYMAGQSQVANAEDNREVVVASAGGVDRAEIEGIVHDYLLANPGIMREMQTLLDAQEKEEELQARLQVIADARAEIFNSGYDGFIGNPDGKVTIVEFYDYNCGFCKRAQEDMLTLTAADPDLRFVLKEFPILGPDSQKAHVVSMAFRALMPEKFGDFHNQLISAPGRATEEAAIRIALSLGADETKLRAEMANPSIQEAFGKTYELANKLSITGTPSYVVGNEVVFGALGADVLTEKIEVAKACVDNATC